MFISFRNNVWSFHQHVLLHRNTGCRVFMVAEFNFSIRELQNRGTWKGMWVQNFYIMQNGYCFIGCQSCWTHFWKLHIMQYGYRLVDFKVAELLFDVHFILEWTIWHSWCGRGIHAKITTTLWISFYTYSRSLNSFMTSVLHQSEDCSFQGRGSGSRS